MRTLLIGTGARTSALAQSLSAHDCRGTVFALAAEAAVGTHAHVIDARPDPIAVAVAAFKHRIDLVVLDPAVPGADRIAGALDTTGTTSIGAGTFATRAAASRAWTLGFLTDNRIPTVEYHIFDDPAAAAAHAAAAAYPLTVAGDRPGTPSRYCRNPSESIAVIDALTAAVRGERLLMRRADAPEVVMSFWTDGTAWLPMPHCHDLGHPGRAGRDLVPAAATPAPALTPGLERIITAAVIAPFHTALATARLGHRGPVTARIALDPTGPKVADLYPGLLDAYAPLALPLIEHDLSGILAAVADGRVADTDASWSDQHAVSLTATGPVRPRDREPDRWRREVPGTSVFEAGPAAGAAVRHLTVVGTGSTFKNARNRAYARAAWLHYDSHYTDRLVPGGAA